MTRMARYCIAVWCSGWAHFPPVAVLDGLQNAARAESGGIKLTVLYAKPKDPDAFNKYYLNKHMPLVAKIPWASANGGGDHPTAPAGSTGAAILADHRALLPERSTISKRGSHPRRVKRPLRI